MEKIYTIIKHDERDKKGEVLWTHYTVKKHFNFFGLRIPLGTMKRTDLWGDEIDHDFDSLKAAKRQIKCEVERLDKTISTPIEEFKITL